MIAWMRGLAASLPFHGVTRHVTNFHQMHTDLMAVREFLVELERKLEAAMAEEMARPKANPLTADELVAAASSSTAVFKAIEVELGSGWDQRTIRGKVERLIKVHALEARYPEGSRDLALAKYLAERLPDGRFRIQHALEALA
jgi:hypothetical protein